MARGIIDCTGKTINIGDRVRTERGDVIEVAGGMVSEHFLFNAETCTHVPSNTPLTKTGKPTGTKTMVTDCVVWGD